MGQVGHPRSSEGGGTLNVAGQGWWVGGGVENWLISMNFIFVSSLKTLIDILCVDKAKLDSSYPNAQFHVDGYQFPPFRKDRNKYGGEKMVYLRYGIMAKCLESLEGKNNETICLELTAAKKKWRINFAYRPPSYDNKAIFFNELTT